MLAALLSLPAVSLVPELVGAQTLDRIERERASQMLIMLKDDIKKNYYDPNYHGLDLDARFETAQQKLKQATSLGQAFGIVAQTLLDFNDSHTYFIPPPRPGRVEYGWEMQMIGDKCYVVRVKPKSDAEKQGLKPGDAVLSVEGFKPARKEFWKLGYYYNTLSPRRGLRVVVQSPGGEPRQLDVAAKVTEGNVLHDNIIDRERPDHHRFWQEQGVSIWKMGGFDLSEAEVDARVNKVRASRALILDMRGNGGGYVITLQRLLGHFFEREVKVGDVKERKELKSFVAKKTTNMPFGGKVIVLLDSESGSAAELFGRVMQLEKRGSVIGDQSAGAVMRSRTHSHDVGGGSLVVFGASITNADVIMTDGKSLERVGVTPDELVLPTGADLAARRDPVLARALELAGLKVTPEKAGTFFPPQW
jgi:C-terminal processing protease CtpA/Prc